MIDPSNMLYRCCTCTSNKWRVFSLLLYIEKEQETSYKNKEETLSSLPDNLTVERLIDQSSVM